MRHIIPISGKDSLATALVQTAREPSLHYEYVFNDVGAELPDTYEWLDRVEETMGWEIQRIGSDLKEVIRDQGILPSVRMRFCTRMSKIQPMQEWLGGESVTIYYGIRADEERDGYVPIENQEVRYPLKEFGIDLDGVYRILDSQDLHPPSFWWQAMYLRVLSLIGSGWEDAFERWQLESLFAWRSRANCSFCFFQRQYEWIGLYEHYPDLFWEAVWMEKTVGGAGYTWRKTPMTIVLDPDWREEKKDRRARQIVRHIREATQQSIFTNEDSALAGTSCGVLCGK